MSWYAAHIVLYVEKKQQPQDRFPVWENIVLIEAATEDEAFDKAEAIGRDNEGDDDGSFRWAGEPARWVFAGVRKLTTCENEESRPGDGTELTFLQMEVGSREALERLVDSRPVLVEFNEPFPSEETVSLST
jgi:Domain of unknown function (DUF4288)